MVADAVLASGALAVSTGLPPKVGITNPPADGVGELWATAVPDGMTNPPVGGAGALDVVVGGIAKPPANEGGVALPVDGVAGGVDAKLADTGPVGWGADGVEPGSG